MDSTVGRPARSLDTPPLPATEPTDPLWRRWWPCIVILALGLAIRAPLIGLEFGRNADGTGSFYALMARNYLAGTSGPLGMPTLSVAASPGTLYAHHPPLVPWLTALSLWLFGDNVPAARLAPTFFTCASAVLAYGLTRRAGALAASAASIVLLFTPMALRFGQMPDVVNAQIVFTSLLILAAYDCALRTTPLARSFTPLALVFLLGVLTDWPTFFWTPVLVAHAFATRRFRLGLLVGAYACLLFAALYLWCSLAAGDFHLILHQFLNRATQSETDDRHVFTWARWLSGVTQYNLTLHTLPLLLAAAAAWVAILVTMARRRSVQLSPVPRIALLSLGWAITHAIIGRQGNLNHDWWWWPTTLALALALPAGITLFQTARARAAVFAMLVITACWWTATEMRHLLSPHWVLGDIPEYSSATLGRAIQASAPPGSAVMLFANEEQPYTLYNANRPLLMSVWNAETFERRRAQPVGDLFYNFKQRVAGPPVAFLFPKPYAPKGQPLLDYLRARFPERDLHENGLDRFWCFDLTQPLPTSRATP